LDEKYSLDLILGLTEPEIEPGLNFRTY